jgi:transcription initiation factor IIE alpha subunit
MQRRLGTIDLDTGEIHENGIPVWVGKKPKISERWFMAFQEAFEALATDKDLTLEHLRVLNFLFSRIDFENFIQLQQSEISEILSMDKAKVSKAISKLVDKKIIIRGPKIGRSSSFRLNPNYGWKGKVSNLREAQRKHLEIVK